jgi:succinate-semialdehyde dehydrogenase / glutarate-semialdehyde dehydrogenase
VQAAQGPVMVLKDGALLRQQAYIDGRWLDADDGATITVNCPADGSRVGTVPKMGAAETRRAIDAANAAWPAWRAKSAKERAAILRKWFNLMMQSQEDLGILMTVEQGKPLTESKGEVAAGASYVEWAAEEGKRIYGDTIPAPANDRRIVVIKQPIGVCGLVTPWNFPNALVLRKLGPALAAGCTVVLKPASATPFSTLALCELAERAGIPKGVLNVVTGAAGPIGMELTTNPIVRKFSFTGSTEVGKQLMAQCAGTVKKVSMELGGNAPFIVFDDADLDAAVEGALASKFRNSGQTCVCANRLYVQEGVYERFSEKFAAKVAAMKVGNGLEPGVVQGPMIDLKAVEKVEEHIGDATAKGARILTGGKRHALGGTFFEPTVLADAKRDMKVAREETFGPVAPLFRFKTEEELVRLANDTEYGLASYFYSRDIGRIWRVAEALEYGIVGINIGLVSNEMSPFGGMKESGIGRESSKYGIEEYLEVKYLCLGGIDK